MGRSRAYAAKRYWFREAELDVCRRGADAGGAETGDAEAGEDGSGDGMSGRRETDTAGQAAFEVVGCAVPPFYYKKRTWKPQVLSEAMERVPRRIEGMTDTWVHPQVAAMLTTAYEGRFATRRETVQMMTAQMIRQYAARTIETCGEAVVLLGAPADTDLQMHMTGELIRPYLPRINRLLIFYEEVAETDIWVELGSHLDEYYYEYGLVPQLEPYAVSYSVETADSGIEISRMAGVQMPGEGEPETQGRRHVLRCGKPRCGGVILDYCGQFRYPKLQQGSRAVYIDVASEAAKERLLRRKTPWIPYISPLKYLDTIVKSGYDR